MKHIHGHIPHMFDYYAFPVVYLLLKSSLDDKLDKERLMKGQKDRETKLRESIKGWGGDYDWTDGPMHACDARRSFGTII